MTTSILTRRCGEWSRRHLRVVWLLLALWASVGTSTVAAELVAPYVPTVSEDVELMLDIGGVGADDYVIDLGAGDGRIVIGAALRGAVAHGVELTASLIDQSRANAAAAGVADRTAFLHGDIFDADIAHATVIMLFLMPEANLRLRPKLLAELRPGTRVVSNSFDMGDWKADRMVQGRTSGGVLLWIIPANVAGRWRVTVDDPALDGAALSLRIEQHFQEIVPTLEWGARPYAVRDAVLNGKRIAFVAHGRESDDEVRNDVVGFAFNGTVAETGDEMRGYVQLQDDSGTRLARWRAVPDEGGG